MIANVDEIYERELRPGQRIAMAVAETVGSWRFIVGQSLLLEQERARACADVS